MSQRTDCQSSPLTNGPLVKRTTELKDGTIVVLRPLQKKDEPLMSDMFRGCTSATLRQRFQYSFKLTPEWIAGRCEIDRAHEIAIVAEINARGAHQLAGLSRLAFSPDHESAEFGILITDNWQGKGLGARMTRYCLEVARNRGAMCVTAITTLENRRMIKVFRNEGFLFDCDWANGVIRARKKLSTPASPPRDSFCKKARLQRSA